MARWKRRWIAGALAAALVGGIGTAGQALAATVTCGQTLTQDTTVDNDLTGCHDIGLRIGADNITVDLGGHTIDGYDPEFGIGRYGIFVSNRTGVTIKNGTITAFSAGVQLTNSSGNRLSGLSTPYPIDAPGINVDASSNDNVITHVQAETHYAQPGIVLGGDRNVVVDSSASTAVNCMTSAIEVQGDGNRIERTTARNIRESGLCGADGFEAPAVRIRSGDGNQIVANTLSDSNDYAGPMAGLQVEAPATNTLVQGNVASRNSGDGILVESASTTLVGNLADGNGGAGIHAVPGVKGNSNTAQGNNTGPGNEGQPQCVNVRCERRLFGAGRTLPATFSTMTGQAKRASPFTLFYPANVRKLYVYVDGKGAATGSQKIRGLLYANAAGGGPGALLAPTFEFTVPAGMGGRWVELFLAPPLHLNAGVYWLGIHSGNQGSIARFAWESKPGSRHFNIDAYADGPADPFGPAPSDNQQLSIFATGAYGSG